MTSTGTNFSKASPSPARAASQGQMPQETKPVAVISDFDDTIAIENVAELLFEELCSDQGWRELRQQSRDKLISLKDYQERAFRMTGASLEEIQAKVKEKVTLRPHFKGLWDYTQQAGIPLVIVSLGMDFYIEALLAREGLDSIPRFSASGEFSNETISYSYPYTWDGSGASPLEVCSQWGTCKCSIVNGFIQEGYAVNYIGDGRSDMCPASMADHIFARSYLAELCQEKQLAYTPFETFMDVVQGLKARAGVEAS